MSDFINRTKKMTLKGLEEKIKCPIWVRLAEEDLFFKGQPEKVKEALGEKATLVTLTMEDAAGQHCHIGALALMNQHVMDWFQNVIERK